MSSEPIRLLEGVDVSDVERSLLRAGRSVAPVEYDVTAGAARFRTQLAALAAAGAVTAGASAGVSGANVAVRGKVLLAKLAFKVVLGLMAGGVFAGAGVVAGMHLARTSERHEAAPPPPKADAIGVTAPAIAPVPSSVEPAPAPPRRGVAPAALSPETHSTPLAPARPTRESARHPVPAPAHVQGATTSPPYGGEVDDVAGAASSASPDVAGAANPAPSPVVASAPPVPVPSVVAPQPAAPPLPVPQPAAQKPADLLSEVRAVALARTLVERDPEAALELLDKTRREHPAGYFAEERQALTVVALSRSGRQAAAREQAAAFLRAYPNGPFSDRVRAVAGP
jgi:hypothetical protein